MSTRRRLREPSKRQQPRRNYDEEAEEVEVEEPAAKKPTTPADVNYINIMLQSPNPPANNDDLDHIRYLQVPTDIIDESKKRGRRSIWMKKSVTINFREYVQQVSHHVVIRFRKCSRNVGDMNYLPADITVQVNDQLINPPPLHPDLQGRVNVPIVVPKHMIRGPDVNITFKSSEFYTPNNFVYSVEVAQLSKKLPPHKTTGLYYRRKKAVKENIRTLLNSDSDISLISLTLSLMCPIGQKRIEVPGRSSSCTHFQCFDVVSFLVLYAGKQGKKNYCPVCHTAIWQNSLFIDQYMEEILANSKTDKIEFDLDAEWKSVIEGRIQSINADEPVVADALRLNANSVKQEKTGNRSTIDLTELASDDDSDDSSSWDSDGSGDECPCGKCKTEKEEKEARAKAGPIIVDLTLDSE